MGWSWFLWKISHSWVIQTFLYYAIFYLWSENILKKVFELFISKLIIFYLQAFFVFIAWLKEQRARLSSYGENKKLKNVFTCKYNYPFLTYSQINFCFASCKCTSEEYVLECRVGYSILWMLTRIYCKHTLIMF